MKVVRQGPCVGQPSRCRGGTCSCCPDCGTHRWNFDGSRCLTCNPVVGMRVKVRRRKVSEPKIRKPTGKALKEALAFYEAAGKTPPWER